MSWRGCGLNERALSGIDFILKLRSTGYASMAALLLIKGVRDERSATTGGNAQGRIRPDVGWQARQVGRQRPSFCRLGNLPPQRVAREPESRVCLADQRLVWTDHSAPPLRRQNFDKATHPPA